MANSVVMEPTDTLGERQSRTGFAGVFSRRSLLGFLLLLAVLTPFKVWRAGLESSIWCDETYSLLMSNKPFSEIAHITSTDVHPPGYYILLKFWAKPLRILGHEPGILWMRAMNLAAWGLLAGAAWFGGRLLFGATTGTVLAWCLAGSAHLAMATKNLRGYAYVVPLLFICFLVLIASYRLYKEGRRDTSARQALLWFIYFLCAAASLWIHLLSAIMLFVLGLVWLALTDQSKAYTSKFGTFGILSQLGAVIAYLPWLMRIPGQLGGDIYNQGTWWQDESNLYNLYRVFAFWFPFSEVYIPDQMPLKHIAWLVLGTLSFLVPLILLVFAIGRARREGNGWPLFAMGCLGIACAFGFTLITWLIPLLGLGHTFHGPRYPVLGLGPWVLGLVVLSGWSLDRFGLNRQWLWAVMAPWIFCSFLGQNLIHRLEQHGEIYGSYFYLSDFYPREGEPLYVYPPELIPFFRNTLSPFDVRRIEELRDLPPDTAETSVLDLNIWVELDWQRDTYAQALLQGELIAEDIRSFNFPERGPFPLYTIYRLEGIQHDRLQNALSSGFRPKPPPIPATAVAAAPSHEQPDRFGWHVSEINTDLLSFRWGSRETSEIQFDRPVEPGEYTLYLVGYRQPYPAEQATLVFHVQGEDERIETVAGEGGFQLQLPITLKRSHDPLVLSVTCPTWVPKEHLDGSRDPRELSFLFNWAWLEKRDGGSSF